MVGSMIAGTHQIFFIMVEFDNLQICENLIPSEPIEMQTWLTSHLNQNIHFLFSVLWELLP